MSAHFKLGELRKPVEFGSQVSATIGKAVLTHRVAAGMSREKVAQAAGVSKCVVRRLERGQCSTALERASDVLEALGLELIVQKRGER